MCWLPGGGRKGSCRGKLHPTVQSQLAVVCWLARQGTAEAHPSSHGSTGSQGSSRFHSLISSTSTVAVVLLLHRMAFQLLNPHSFDDVEYSPIPGVYCMSPPLSPKLQMPSWVHTRSMSRSLGTVATSQFGHLHFTHHIISDR